MKNGSIMETGVVVYNLSTTQEVEAGELSLIWGQSVLCYNVKLQPAYSLKRIKSLKRYLEDVSAWMSTELFPSYCSFQEWSNHLPRFHELSPLM